MPAAQSRNVKRVSVGNFGKSYSPAPSPHSQKQGGNKHLAGNSAVAAADDPGARWPTASNEATAAKTSDARQPDSLGAPKVKMTGLKTNSRSNSPSGGSTCGHILCCNNPKGASKAVPAVNKPGIAAVNTKAAALAAMVEPSAAAAAPRIVSAGMSPRAVTTATPEPRPATCTVTTAGPSPVAAGRIIPATTEVRPPWNTNSKIIRSPTAATSGNTSRNCLFSASSCSKPGALAHAKTFNSSSDGSTNSSDAAGISHTAGAMAAAGRPGSDSGLRKAASERRPAGNVPVPEACAAGACSGGVAGGATHTLSVYLECCEAAGMQPCDTPTRVEAADPAAASVHSTLSAQPVIHFHCVPAASREVPESSGQQHQQQQQQHIAGTLGDTAAHRSCYVTCDAETMVLLSDEPQLETAGLCLMQHELQLATAPHPEVYSNSANGECVAISFAGSTMQQRAGQHLPAATAFAGEYSCVEACVHSARTPHCSEPAPAAEAATIAAAAAAALGMPAGVETDRREHGIGSSTSFSSTSFSSSCRASSTVMSPKVCPADDADASCLFSTPKRGERQLFSRCWAELTGEVHQTDSQPKQTAASAADKTAPHGAAAILKLMQQAMLAVGDEQATAERRSAEATAAGPAAEQEPTTPGLSGPLSHACFAAVAAGAAESCNRPTGLAALLPLLPKAPSVSDGVPIAIAAEQAQGTGNDAPASAGLAMPVVIPPSQLGEAAQQHLQQQKVGLTRTAKPAFADMQPHEHITDALADTSVSRSSSITSFASGPHHRPFLSCEMPLMDMLQRGDTAAVAAITDRLTRRLSATTPVVRMADAHAAPPGAACAAAWNGHALQSHAAHAGGRPGTTATAIHCNDQHAALLLFEEGSGGSYETDDDSVDSDTLADLGVPAHREHSDVPTAAAAAADREHTAVPTAAAAAAGAAVLSLDTGAAQDTGLEVSLTAARAALALAFQRRVQVDATGDTQLVPVQAPDDSAALSEGTVQEGRTIAGMTALQSPDVVATAPQSRVEVTGGSTSNSNVPITSASLLALQPHEQHPQLTQPPAVQTLAPGFAFSAERSPSSEMLPDELPTPHFTPRSLSNPKQKGQGQLTPQSIGQSGMGLVAVSQLGCGSRALKAAKAELKAAVAVKQQQLQLTEQFNRVQCSSRDSAEVSVPAAVGGGKFVTCVAAAAANFGHGCDYAAVGTSAFSNVLGSMEPEQPLQPQQAAIANTEVSKLQQRGYVSSLTGSLRIQHSNPDAATEHGTSSSNASTLPIDVCIEDTGAAAAAVLHGSNNDNLLAAVMSLSGSGACSLLPEAHTLAVGASQARSLLQQLSSSRRLGDSIATSATVSNPTSSINDRTVSAHYHHHLQHQQQQHCKATATACAEAAAAEGNVPHCSCKHNRRPSCHSRQLSMDGSSTSGSEAAALAAIAAELEDIKRCSYNGSGAGGAMLRTASYNNSSAASVPASVVRRRSSSHRGLNHVGECTASSAAAATEPPPGQARRSSYHSRHVSMDGCSNVEWLAQLRQELGEQQQQQRKVDSCTDTGATATATAALNSAFPSQYATGAAAVAVGCAVDGDAASAGPSRATAAAASAGSGDAGVVSDTTCGVMSISSQQGQQLLNMLLPPQDLYTLLKLLAGKRLGHHDSQRRRAILELLESEGLPGSAPNHAGCVKWGVLGAGYAEAIRGWSAAGGAVAKEQPMRNGGCSDIGSGSSCSSSSVECTTGGGTRKRQSSKGTPAASISSNAGFACSAIDYNAAVSVQTAAASSGASSPAAQSTHSVRCCTLATEESSAVTSPLPKIDFQDAHEMTFIWNPAYELSRQELQLASRPFPTEPQLDCKTVCSSTSTVAAVGCEAATEQLTSTGVDCITAGAQPAAAGPPLIAACCDSTDAYAISASSTVSPSMEDPSSTEAPWIDTEGLPALEQVPSVVVNDNMPASVHKLHDRTISAGECDRRTAGSDARAIAAATPSMVQAVHGDGENSGRSTLSGSELSCAIAVLTELKGLLQEDTNALRSSLSACMQGAPPAHGQSICITQLGATGHDVSALQQARQTEEDPVDHPGMSRGIESSHQRGSGLEADGCSVAGMGTVSVAYSGMCPQQPLQQLHLLEMVQQLVQKLATYATLAGAGSVKQPSQPLARTVLHQLYPSHDAGCSSSSRGAVGLARTLSSQVRETLAGSTNIITRHVPAAD